MVAQQALSGAAGPVSALVADIEGPGTINHVWLTVPPAPPEQLRALLLEVFYDDAREPSMSTSSGMRPASTRTRTCM